jgi:hypothetical protein
VKISDSLPSVLQESVVQKVGPIVVEVEDRRQRRHNWPRQGTLEHGDEVRSTSSIGVVSSSQTPSLWQKFRRARCTTGMRGLLAR